METRSGMGSVMGRISRRAVILGALLVLSLAGGVLLTRIMPHSNLGAIVFLVGIFLLLPLAVGEVQGAGGAGAGSERGDSFVYGSVDINDNPAQMGVHTTSALDEFSP